MTGKSTATHWRKLKMEMFPISNKLSNNWMRPKHNFYQSLSTPLQACVRLSNISTPMDRPPVNRGHLRPSHSGLGKGTCRNQPRTQAGYTDPSWEITYSFQRTAGGCWGALWRVSLKKCWGMPISNFHWLPWNILQCGGEWSIHPMLIVV